MITLNGYVVGNKCYPNNERILEIQEFDTDEFTIEFKYTTDIDISVLMMTKLYLDDMYANSKVTLIMKYVPYSRMDRYIDGYMFSLRYFCKMINDLKFDKVVVLDPHSNMVTGLLDRCYEINIDQYLSEIFARVNIDYVFYPDAGASKRYREILRLNKPNFCGHKERNLKTGQIIDYQIVNCPDIKDKDILIIDDLCAKGFTFYNASLRLKEKGARNIYLYVSHCEDSVYKGELIKSTLINRIFTTDSILSDWSSQKIHRLYV